MGEGYARAEVRAGEEDGSRPAQGGPEAVEGATVTAASAYLGPVLCMCCGGVIRAARPGYEGMAPSHGLGRCCWAAYRAASGMAPKPYPVESEAR